MVISMNSILSAPVRSSQFLRSELVNERSLLVAELRYLRSYVVGEASTFETRAMIRKVADCEAKLIAVQSKLKTL